MLKFYIHTQHKSTNIQQKSNCTNFRTITQTYNTISIIINFSLQTYNTISIIINISLQKYNTISIIINISLQTYNTISIIINISLQTYNKIILLFSAIIIFCRNCVCCQRLWSLRSALGQFNNDNVVLCTNRQ